MSFRFSSFVLGFVVLCFLSACGGKSDTEYLAAAQQYYQQGNPVEAAIDARNALQVNASNAEARLLLGTILLQSQDLATAEKELTRALELGVAADRVVPLLAQVKLRTRQFDDLLALQVTSLSDEPRALLLAAQGEALLLRGDRAAAEVPIAEATALAPDKPEVMTARAHLLNSQRQQAEAKSLLANTVQQHPDFAPAWEALGDIALSEDKFEAAQEDYTRAIEADSYSPNASMKRAIARIGVGDVDGAMEDTRALLAIMPDAPGANLVQGVIEFNRKEYKSAIESLDKVLIAIDQYPQALLYLGLAHWFDGGYESSRSYTNQYLAKYPNNAIARELAARVELELGNFARAEELISPVVDFGPPNPVAANILAEALIGQRKLEEGAAVLSELAVAEADSTRTQLRLGVVELSLGESGSGEARLRRAIEVDPDFYPAQAMLVNFLIAKGDSAAALLVAQEFQEAHPDDYQANNLLGHAYLAQGEVDKAETHFLAAYQKEPGNPIAGQQLALVAMKKGSPAVARDYYEAILKSSPDYLPVLEKMIALDRLEGRNEQVVQHFKAAITAYPANLELRAGLGNYYLSLGQPERVDEAIAGLDAAQVDIPPLLKLRALTALELKQFKKAIQLLEQLLPLAPDSTAIHMLMAKAYGGLGDTAAMRAELEKVIALEEGFVEARVALARLLVTQGNLEEAEPHIELLRSSVPESAMLAQMEATVASMRGDEKLALQKYGEAFSRGPSTDRMRMVAAQRWKLADVPGARQVHQDWLEDHPGDVEAMLSLADVHLASGDQAAALVQFQNVLQLDPDNRRALIGLAWNLRLDQPARALEYANKASQLYPESARVQDTLAMVLLGNGDLARAERAMERAQEIAPNSPGIRYHAAVIDVEAGNTARAALNLRKLVESGAQFPERATAVALLQRLSEN
jgi:putative PEP-CTERM system TPR-repeat lipoprotein